MRPQLVIGDTTYGNVEVHEELDRLHGRLRPRKNGQEVLGFYRQIRIRYHPRSGST